MFFRIPMSIKLIFSITAILLTSLAVVSYNTLNIQIQDKTNSTYESQMSEARIASEMLSSKIESTLNVLKQIAAQYRVNEKTDEAKIDSIFKNQLGVKNLIVGELPLETATGEIEILPMYLGNYKPEKISLISEDLSNKNLEKTYALSSLEDQMVVYLIDKDYDPNNKVILVLAAIVDSSNIIFNFKHQKLIALTESGENFFEINNDIETQVLLENIEQENKSFTFSNGEDKYLGSFVGNKFGVKVFIVKSWQMIMAPVYELIEKFILITLLVLFVGIPFAIILSRRLTRPIEKLCVATDAVSKGNFDVKTKIKSRDEIGKLSHVFDQMTSKIKKLTKDQIEKVRLDNEAKTASLVQKNLIPDEKIKGKNFLINSVYKSASECGGDWWGYIEKENKLFVMIGDATGHGIPSALITASAQSFCSIMTDLLKTSDFSPKQFLELANNSIYSSSKGEIMMTFFVAEIDFTSKTIDFANAGHNPPWLIQKSLNKNKIKPLMASGKRLGEKPNEKDFGVGKMSFNEGDKIFLYTDGVIEGTNTENKEFGKKRMRKLVEKNTESGESILKSVINDFLSFLQGKKYADDDTTLVMVDLGDETKGEENAA